MASYEDSEQDCTILLMKEIIYQQSKFLLIYKFNITA